MLTLISGFPLVQVRMQKYVVYFSLCPEHLQPLYLLSWTQESKCARCQMT